MLRSFIALVFIVTAGLFTFPASLAFWEQRVLMNEERFITLGHEALERDEVQLALARRIAAEAEALEPRLSGEPALFLAQGLVSQLPRSSIANDALARAHALLRRLVRDESVDVEEEGIVLDLHPVVEHVVSELALTVGRELPPDAGQITIVEHADFAEGFRAARWFDTIAPIFIALPFVGFALAVLISPARLFAIAACGFVAALTAGIRIFLLETPLASAAVNATFVLPDARGATRETYDVLAATFVSQEFVILIAGLVVAIATLFLVTARVLTRAA